jgi:hypothetical protein
VSPEASWATKDTGMRKRSGISLLPEAQEVPENTKVTQQIGVEPQILHFSLDPQMMLMLLSRQGLGWGVPCLNWQAPY